MVALFTETIQDVTTTTQTERYITSPTDCPSLHCIESLPLKFSKEYRYVFQFNEWNKDKVLSIFYYKYFR